MDRPSKQMAGIQLDRQTDRQPDGSCSLGMLRALMEVRVEWELRELGDSWLAGWLESCGGYAMEPTLGAQIVPIVLFAVSLSCLLVFPLPAPAPTPTTATKLLATWLTRTRNKTDTSSDSSKMYFWVCLCVCVRNNNNDKIQTSNYGKISSKIYQQVASQVTPNCQKLKEQQQQQ